MNLISINPVFIFFFFFFSFFFLFFDNQKLRYSYSSNKSQLNSPVGLDKLPRVSIRRDSREVIGKITSKQNVHATRKRPQDFAH